MRDIRFKKVNGRTIPRLSGDRGTSVYKSHGTITGVQPKTIKHVPLKEAL